MSLGSEEPKGAGSQTIAEQTGQDSTQEQPRVSPQRRRGVRGWFQALLRSFGTVIITLVVLFVLGVTGSVALHQVERTTTATTPFSGVTEIDITVDGDGSLDIQGSQTAGNTVAVTTTDRATVFDPPQRTMVVVGSVLAITEHCPDSQCSSDLAVTAGPEVALRIHAGGAVRTSNANLSLSNLTGPITLYAAPATVTVSNTSSLVTGLVIGSLDCRSPAVCLVQTAA
jgi:hypothetical protein